MKPIKKLKTLVTLNLAVGLLYSANALTQEMPYVGPQCPNMIAQPKGSSGYFRSKDCTTVMVLPATEGQIDVRSFMPNHNLMRCQTLKELETSKLDLQKAIDNNTNRLNNEKDPKRQEEYKHLISDLQAMVEKSSPLADVEGAILQVVLNGGVQAADVEQYVLANMPVLNTTRFVPAPMTEAMMTFTPARTTPSGAPILGDAILDMQIPGAKKEPNGYSILGIGAKSGVVTLSLAGACPMVGYPSPDTDLRKLKFDESSNNLAIAVNYTYSVPVMFPRGYTARLETGSFLDAVVQETKEHRQFTLQDIYKKTVKLGADSFFHISFSDFTGQPVADNYQSTIMENVFNRFGSKMLSDLERAGVIINGRVQEAPDAPNGGNVSKQIGTIHHCESQSFIGLTYNSKCWDEPWVVSEWVNGVSSVLNSNKIDINFVLEEKVDNESVQNRYYTQAMAFNQQSREE